MLPRVVRSIVGFVLAACATGWAVAPEACAIAPDPMSGGAGVVRAVPAGPTGAGPVVAAAVDPADPTRQALAERDGAVWLTVDGGRRWRRVLGPVAGLNLEAVLLEIEAAVSDSVGDLDVVEAPDPEAFDDPEALDEAREAFEAELAELEYESADRAHRAAGEAAGEVAGDRERPGLGRVSVELARGILRVERSDGTWTSSDGGLRWRHRADVAGGAAPSRPMGHPHLPEPPGGLVAVAEGPEGRLVGVGPEGAWIAGADGRWQRVEGVGPASAVAAAGEVVLVVGGGLVYRLEPGGESGPRADPDPPLPMLIEALLRSEGRAARAGRRTWIRAVPDLTVEAVYDTAEAWRFVPGPGATRRIAGAWGAVARLEWTPRRRRTRVHVVADARGRAVILDGPSAWEAVARAGAARRSDRVDRLIALYDRRAEWLETRRRTPDGELLARVGCELELAEIDARIDAMTNGALGAVLARP